MDNEFLEFLTCVSSAAGQQVNSGEAGQAHIELWQAINLVGAPLLAVIFAHNR